jgi:hypothetical protein
MVDSFTLYSLVRYTYNESSLEEKEQLEELSLVDNELNDELKMLQEAKQFLPKVTFYPLESSMQRILQYSSR